MLPSVYMTCPMMVLPMESVPAFNTWIECLRDLVRYRMATEEPDLHDRDTWRRVVQYRYNKAVDRSIYNGHVVPLTRRNILQQLFYYSQNLHYSKPFQKSMESI